MHKKYKVFAVLQLLLSAVFCVLLFAEARRDPGTAPAAFFRLGGTIFGTGLFFAVQPMLSREESCRTGRMLLTGGYALLTAVSMKTLSSQMSLIALCSLILAATGMILYGIAEDDCSIMRKDKPAAIAAEYLMLILTAVCSICGNISLLRSAEIALTGKVCSCAGAAALLAASVGLLLTKRRCAGKLHAIAFLISGILLRRPYMFFVLLLLLAELPLLDRDTGIFENNEEQEIFPFE